MPGFQESQPTIAHVAVMDSPAPARSSGEMRPTRNSSVISDVAARLSSIMKFGSLPTAELYTIGQLADYLGISLRTLRFYEQSGLLRPSREGTKRLYSHADLEQLKVIVTLRDLEASLGVIKSLMSAVNQSSDTTSMIAAVEGLLVAIANSNHERIAELSRLNRRIDDAVVALSAA